MSSKKVVVSFSATGRENYPKAQLRLIKSCIDAGWNGDYLMRTLDGWCDRYEGVQILQGEYPKPKGLPPCHNQAEVPYQFKVFAIQEARDKGYDVIVWCDSTIMMQKDITPLLKIANKRGIVAFHNLGYDMPGWISDEACKRLGVTDDDLEGMPQIMACCIIFDFTNKKTGKIFKEWLKLSQDGVTFCNGYGSTRPGFVATRHDQAALSVLLWQYNVDLEDYGKLVYPPYDTNHKFGSDIYFVNRAIT